MAKDMQQAKQAFTYATGIDLLTVTFVCGIGILLLASNPHLDPDNLVGHLINHYAYPGLKGLIALGITAMAMSMADSELNASAVLAVNDIIKPLDHLLNKRSLPSDYALLSSGFVYWA